jgi:hypothetical protein
MSDATDDLEMEAYFGTRTPVRDMDGTWYVYTYKGVKYQFRTMAEANEWAKTKGFRLSTSPNQNQQKEAADHE